MKPNELMIGDWVQVPSLIDNIEHYDAWCKVKQLRDCDLDVVGFKELNYSEIEPIPITREILEKNDIKYQWGMPWYQCFYSKKGIEFHFNDYCQIYLRYVHEHQHALRLCGIDKEIKL